jgi:hypothetical protein
MKNKRVTTLLAVAMSLTTIGCSEAAPSQGTTRYPAAQRQAFLEGCASESPMATCECMLDQLEQTVPLADLLTLEAAGSEAVFKDDRVIAAVLACVD